MYIYVGGLLSLCRKGESVLKVGALGGALLQPECSPYYDKDDPDNHYCAMEFRCYLDDSPFTYTLHDDC